MQGGREMLPLNTDEDGTHLGQALRTPDMTEDERKPEPRNPATVF